MKRSKTADEWVIVADRENGAVIVRSGFATPGEAAAVRRELETNPVNGTVNFLLLTRMQAEQMIAEDAQKMGGR